MSDVVVILEKLKEEGFSLWLDGEKLRYKAPKESITKANLLTLKRNKEEIIQVLQNYSKRIVVEVDSDNRYEPFPLTDVQTAYLMGRNNLFDYGGVACHVYLELKYKNLDVSRVRLVWNKLIQTHDMLRTVVFEEGYQQVLKEVPELEIPYWDVSKGENICEYNDFRQQWEIMCMIQENGRCLVLLLQKSRRKYFAFFDGFFNCRLDKHLDVII